jgi:hypothetical protein
VAVQDLPVASRVVHTHARRNRRDRVASHELLLIVKCAEAGPPGEPGRTYPMASKRPRCMSPLTQRNLAFTIPVARITHVSEG